MSIDTDMTRPTHFPRPGGRFAIAQDRLAVDQCHPREEGEGVEVEREMHQEEVVCDLQWTGQDRTGQGQWEAARRRLMRELCLAGPSVRGIQKLEWNGMDISCRSCPRRSSVRLFLFFFQQDFDSLTDCTYSMPRSRSSIKCSEAVRLRTDRRTDPVPAEPKRTEASF